VGYLFGFQAFNHAVPAPSGGRPAGDQGSTAPVSVPAVIPLAADHLNALLGAQYTRIVEEQGSATQHQPGCVTQEEQGRAFRQAVLTLAATLLSPYMTEW
jgi:hypothetical protein